MRSPHCPNSLSDAVSLAITEYRGLECFFPTPPRWLHFHDPKGLHPFFASDPLNERAGIGWLSPNQDPQTDQTSYSYKGTVLACHDRILNSLPAVVFCSPA